MTGTVFSPSFKKKESKGVLRFKRFHHIENKVCIIYETIIDQIILLESINALSSATTEREKEISPRAKRTE